MAKYLALFLIVVCVTLFYPFRDLYVREDAFSSSYTLVKKGFWSRDACLEAAAAQPVKDFRCSRRTMMGTFLGTSARYGHADFEDVNEVEDRQNAEDFD